MKSRVLSFNKNFKKKMIVAEAIIKKEKISTKYEYNVWF